jgi:DNA polymerase-3 subunit epsilon
MRQIVLDTETTGLDPSQGHRIIEIGCVEIDNRRLTGRHYHCYLNPERDIDEGAIQVHGITAEFLADKPRFSQVAEEFLKFVSGAELIIHNAPFDLGFLNHELQLIGHETTPLHENCNIVDTLVMARKKHPGQRNSLDALCKRYEVDNSQRELHGALLDAEILADVYLLMSGGQTMLQLGNEQPEQQKQNVGVLPETSVRGLLKVSIPEQSDLAAHAAFISRISQLSQHGCLWAREGSSAEEVS